MLSYNHIEEAASRLATAERIKTQIPILSLDHPDMSIDDAYAIQAAWVQKPNRMGKPVTAAQAYDMIVGSLLLNDWSARDIQTWEYQPLGPFQSKAFATSISPWIVTREALEPFRTSTLARVTPLLPYLRETAPNNFDIHLEVSLRRLEDATRFIDVSQLAISPQCGFASGLAGNDLSEDQQWWKLEVIQATARRVWG